jgi:hypothetical protein
MSLEEIIDELKIKPEGFRHKIFEYSKNSISRYKNSYSLKKKLKYYTGIAGLSLLMGELTGDRQEKITNYFNIPKRSLTNTSIYFWSPVFLTTEFKTILGPGFEHGITPLLVKASEVLNLNQTAEFLSDNPNTIGLGYIGIALSLIGARALYSFKTKKPCMSVSLKSVIDNSVYSVANTISESSFKKSLFS